MKTWPWRGAGWDVHKDAVVACVRRSARGKASHEVRRFPTTTRGLGALAEWLAGEGCTPGALAATGVDWKPVWPMLESQFALVPATAAQGTNVPGRKRDVNDATGLAALLAHGLIRARFVPPTPIQELRDLTRTRKQLTREIVQPTQRIQAVLEAAVITDLMGMSGRRSRKAMIAGETAAAKLVALGSQRRGCARAARTAAVRGDLREHQRFLLEQHLKTIAQLEATVAVCDARIEAAPAPFRAAADRLTTIPGIGTRAAQVLLAEIGADMSPFPTAGHWRSWAGLVPRLDASAGRRRSSRVNQGAPWLHPVLVPCAWAAARTPNSYLQAQFQRLKARRGAKKAALAGAGSILTAAYHMLRDGVAYRDLGPDHCVRHSKARAAARLANRIRELGHDVQIQAAAGFPPATTSGRLSG